MFQKLNLQYFFSYTGLIPFFYIIFDKYLFLQLKEEIIINFALYYSLLILVFIGSMNWNLKIKVDNFTTIYGFLPSLLAMIMVFLNLINFDYFYTIAMIIIVLLLQLFFDYIFIYGKEINKTPFYLIRTPLTLIIILILALIIY